MYLNLPCPNIKGMQVKKQSFNKKNSDIWFMTTSNKLKIKLCFVNLFY